MSDLAAGPAGSGAARAGLPISVHGPAGIVDLLVPEGATPADVAREYVDAAGLAGPAGTLGVGLPVLCDRNGEPLPTDRGLGDLGVDRGDLLVAAYAPAPEAADAADPGEADSDESSAIVTLWCWIGGAVALLAGYFAGDLAGSLGGSDADRRAIVVGLLAVGALAGAVRIGPAAGPRAVAAPMFGAAAALAGSAGLAEGAGPLRLPMVFGLMGLAAAVTAGVARVLADQDHEALTVWIVCGGLVFVVCGAAAVARVDPQAVWASLLLIALLAARFVPDYAIDVPDEALVDIDRLAVSAWSARGGRASSSGRGSGAEGNSGRGSGAEGNSRRGSEAERDSGRGSGAEADKPAGRRTRLVVPERVVQQLAGRAARIVTAAAAAILLVVLVAAPGLARSVQLTPDRWGLWAELLFVGGGLLLAARSFRHDVARRLLRGSGLVCWTVLAVTLLAGWTGGRLAALTVFAIALGAVCVVAAVATGRGWRSAWWSRRAEVGESMCGAFAIASLVVASGFFRFLWEIKS